jgi:hypothetical protein
VIRRAALVVCFMAASVAWAELSVRSEVDTQKLGVEDQVQLSITVSGGSVPGIPLPALTNLIVASGPASSSQVSFVNGTISQALTHTYWLQPKAPGKAEIGPVQIGSGADVKTAPAITLEVVPGSIRQQQQQQQAPDPMDPFAGGDPFERFFGRGRRGPAVQPKVFMEAALSRNRVYVGEPVLLTYYVYTQTNITDIRANEGPTYTGLWSEVLERPKQAPGGEPATVNGESFRRFPIEQRLLFPTKAGAITIPALGFKIAVARGGGFFDPMSGTAVVERTTKPVALTALPIPQTPDFSGAVGHFTASADLDKTQVAIGDAATLRFSVKGSGNLKWVDRAPELSIPGAKIYPPQVKSDLQTTTSGISGTKTWEFIIVPETAGTLAVPPLHLTYFDPQTGQLAEATTEPRTLVATGSAAPAGSAPVPAASTARAGGPLALRSELDLPHHFLPRLSPRTLAAVLVVLLLVHAGFFVVAWLGEHRRVASGAPAPSRDVRRALGELSRAERDGLSKEAAVALIERTLHDVFGPLDDTGTAPETARERAARDVLQEVYFIRYAPQLGDYSEKIREVARRAADVVRRYA